ncbi:MAG TPA: c-type cytochrome, partial [Vicinamibacterales bacterium]
MIKLKRYRRAVAAALAFSTSAWIAAVLSASDGIQSARQSTGNQEEHARGKALYDSACLSCHGPGGRGMPQSTLGFDIEVPDFTDCSFATPEPD